MRGISRVLARGDLELMARLQRAGWTYSIGVRNYNNVKAQIALIAEDAWTTLADYPDSGEAQIAETVLAGRRMIVRRTRLIGAQAELWPDWPLRVRHQPHRSDRDCRGRTSPACRR